jgi:hypothetical protein
VAVHYQPRIQHSLDQGRHRPIVRLRGALQGGFNLRVEPHTGRRLFDRADPVLLSASAAAVAASLTCGHVDRDFFVEGGWKRAKADPGTEETP